MNDEVEDEVGEEHAHVDVQLGAAQLRLAALLEPLCAQFLDLFRGLPEEQIGRDRRAGDGDDRREEGAVQTEGRGESPAEGRAPVGPSHKGIDDVGEEDQCQELEVGGEDAIGHQYLQHGDANPRRHDDGAVGDAGQQPDASRYSGDVGAEVSGVGDEEHEDEEQEDRAGIAAAQGEGQALAGHKADAGAHVLDGRVQGQRQEAGPEQAVARARARQRVRGDAAGVIVGCAGYDARAGQGQQATDALVQSSGGAPVSRADRCDPDYAREPPGRAPVASTP
jgi:hypothetical protein